MEQGYEVPHRRALILPVGAEDAGEMLGAVEGNPGELAAVVVEEAGGQTHAATGGYVGEGGIVVGAVEMGDAGGQQPVLHRPQGGRRAAAQDPAEQQE